MTVLNEDHSDITGRRIRLDQHNNACPVGRASKVQSKGFVAACDNCWFNSPVMSREHGEIIADLDNLVRPFLVLYIRSLRTNHFQTVSVRDFGSLHGTYVNHEMERIPGRTLHELHDGDEISFGAAILRNGDSYTPTRVKVGIEFNNGYLPHQNRSLIQIC